MAMILRDGNHISFQHLRHYDDTFLEYPANRDIFASQIACFEPLILLYFISIGILAYHAVVIFLACQHHLGNEK